MDTLKGTYLLQVGTNWELSLAELSPRVTVLDRSRKYQLMVTTDLQFPNRRQLPKSPEQLFLDSVGGVVRVAQVVGVCDDQKAVVASIAQAVSAVAKDTKYLLAVGAFGVRSNEVKDIQKALTDALGDTIRIANGDGQTLSSGRLFGDKVLKKGGEFLIWRRGHEWLLAQTVAVQNLRNYTLRDHRKPWRDPHMGMLPPKLAQMLLNLAEPRDGETVIDPFCGSGTISTEAALIGLPSIGTDLSADHISGAKQNADFLSEKFRFDRELCQFDTADATKKLPSIASSVLVTEGWLGINFTSPPTAHESRNSLQGVLRMWQKFFQQLGKTPPRRIVMCMPVHMIRERSQSIVQKVLAFADKAGYAPLALFSGHLTTIYAREGAYTAREILVLESRNNTPE